MEKAKKKLIIEEKIPRMTELIYIKLNNLQVNKKENNKIDKSYVPPLTTVHLSKLMRKKFKSW